MSEHWHISPTAPQTDFAHHALVNELNRILAGIKKRIDSLPITAGQAVTKVQVPQSAAFDPGTPGIGGGTSVPPAVGTQLGGDVTGTLDQTVVGGVQTVPILAPTVDGTVATFVLGVPDIEWKALVSAAQFRIITLAFAASPYSAVLSATQITLYLANSSAGADFIFNLPVATGTGDALIVKKVDANAHNIAVTPNGTNTIDGVNAAVNLTTQWVPVLRLIDSAAGAWSVW